VSLRELDALFLVSGTIMLIQEVFYLASHAWWSVLRKEKPGVNAIEAK
jgi:hypothetical protein